MYKKKNHEYDQEDSESKFDEKLPINAKMRNGLESLK